MGFFEGIKRRVQEAERRSYARDASEPLRLVIGGRRYDTLDWSLGGFKLDRSNLTLGYEEQVRGRVHFKGKVTGEFIADVVHIDESGEIGFRFLEISPRVFLAMSGAFID